MTRARAGRLSVLTCAAALALPGVAEARPIAWGGAAFNDLGPSSALLSVTNGMASVTNVQLIMACTDAEDGTESARAFYARYRTARPLVANRFSFTFSATAGGRVGQVRLTGTLGSNGRGTIRVQVNAVGAGEGGAVVERCSGESTIRLRRGA